MVIWANGYPYVMKMQANRSSGKQIGHAWISHFWSILGPDFESFLDPDFRSFLDPDFDRFGIPILDHRNPDSNGDWGSKSGSEIDQNRDPKLIKIET